MSRAESVQQADAPRPGVAHRVGVVARTGYLVLIYAFIFLPVATLVLFSFQGSTVPVPPFDGPSLRWYGELFSDGRLMSSLGNSVVVGLVSATGATILGFLAAYGLARFRPAGLQALRALLMAPLGVSYLVVALGLSLSANQLGVSRSLTLVTIGHVVINLPLAFAIILSQMNPAQATLERAARDLGAGEFTVLRTVTVPVLAPGLVAAFLLAFTLSWDEFIIALLLARFDVTLPVEIWSALRTGLDPKTNAAGTLVFALSFTLLGLAFAMLRRRTERRR
jgi:spermidine/putrescine transport system permease protein